MKDLRITPTGHEITAVCTEINKDEPDNNYAQVELKLFSDGDTATGALSKTECEKIGKWFLDLSKKLK